MNSQYATHKQWSGPHLFIDYGTVQQSRNK